MTSLLAGYEMMEVGWPPLVSPGGKPAGVGEKVSVDWALGPAEVEVRRTKATCNVVRGPDKDPGVIPAVQSFTGY